jgi:endonuclease/exonuclease/phosphatase family metal-dependent hydrolase
MRLLCCSLLLLACSGNHRIAGDDGAYAKPSDGLADLTPDDGGDAPTGGGRADGGSRAGSGGLPGAGGAQGGATGGSGGIGSAGTDGGNRPDGGGDLAALRSDGGDMAGSRRDGGDAAGGRAEGGTDVAQDPCSSQAELRVMTFNIRYDSGSGGQTAWSQRRERVLSIIGSARSDIVGTQEALSNQVADLKQGLADFEFFGVGRDDGATKGEYAGIFYRKSRFLRVDGGHFWLSTTPDVPGTVFAGSGSVRMATWVVLSDAVVAREIFVLNTHWDNQSASSRKSSASLIRERMATLAAGRPRIMTGDLNESTDGAAVQLLLSDASDADATLIDAYRSVHPKTDPEERTFHDFTGDTRGTRIDFILINAALVGLAAEIDHTTFQGAYASDHFPVTATIGWRASAGGEACAR